MSIPYNECIYTENIQYTPYRIHISIENIQYKVIYRKSIWNYSPDDLLSLMPKLKGFSCPKLVSQSGLVGPGSDTWFSRPECEDLAGCAVIGTGGGDGVVVVVVVGVKRSGERVCLFLVASRCASSAQRGAGFGVWLGQRSEAIGSKRYFENFNSIYNPPRPPFKNSFKIKLSMKFYF